MATLRKDLKRLANTLTCLADLLNSGVCDKILDESMSRTYNKSITEVAKSHMGEHEYSFDEACELIGVSTTQLKNYIKDGLIEPPHPIEYHRVMFSQSQIEELKSTLQHKRG